MPDTSDPKPREAEEHDQPKTASELDFEEYHKLADQYLERLMVKLEQKQEEKTEIDAEYAVRFHPAYEGCSPLISHYRQVFLLSIHMEKAQ
jgi:Frataxin-like domain